MNSETGEKLERYAIRLHPADGVAVAKEDIPALTHLRLEDGSQLVTREAIPAGHKLALCGLSVGEAVLRYGQRIGRASTSIEAGDWVHSHNLEVGPIERDYEMRVVGVEPARPSGRSFLGFRRADGQAGTRNYVAVITTVNCAAAVASRIAAHFDPARMAEFPNVDGVVAVTHAAGCSVAPDSLSLRYLRRSLENLAHNPNVGAAVFVGLGCEVNQLDGCTPTFGGEEIERLAGPGLTIQEQGGFTQTVRAGIAAVERVLPRVNAARREELPLSLLNLALQCGGSDGWSGVTANPLVGRVADRLVAEGGTVVLAETPEIFGAEHLLLERVAGLEVGEKLVERFRWWVEHARQNHISIDNNPSPGNKTGGLTTIFEKSLGAAAKGGASPLMGVLEYAERAQSRGLLFMDTPGNDPVSVSGQLAGGCNLILFTTGRGTVYGSSLAPCIKIASNSRLYARMSEDMDFDAGQVLSGMDWADAEEALLDAVIAAASGRPTASEAYFPREGEFSPWQPDPLL
jgi:altronate dehydratase